MNFRNLPVQLLLIPVILSLLILGGCSEENGDDSSPPLPAETFSVEINQDQVYQKISGFGAANQMWGNSFPSVQEINTAFGTGTNDLGLSIFRIRLASNPDEWSRIIEVTKAAQENNAIIMASPWSPPPALKSNNSDVGGYLLEENYDAYVAHINNFLEFMADNGIQIDVISIQNEPDISVSYESSDWTANQMRDFLANNAAQINSDNIAAAESFNFNRSFTDVILNDDQAAQNVDIIAGHIYGNGEGPYPLAEEKGKEIWMTEYLLNLNATSGWADVNESVIWDESLEMLETLHNAMSNNWNAYIWWYLKRYYSFLGDGTQGTNQGEILKRGYAFSHFSKFVRPGYHRIDVKIPSQPQLRVTAYKGNSEIILVIINPFNQPDANLNIPSAEGLNPTEVYSYTTNLSLNRNESEVEPENGDYPITVPGKSVTTVVLKL